MNGYARLLLGAAAALSCRACNDAPGAANADASLPATDHAANAAAPPVAPVRGPQADIDASLALDPFDGNGGIGIESAPGALPPAERPLRFVGRWATDRAHCDDEGWIFTENRLTTPAGSACRFDRIDRVPGGYDIAARCTAEGPERGDTIRLRFAESAQAMLFESESVADAGLTYCGM